MGFSVSLGLHTQKETVMWMWFGIFGAILYVTVMFTLGFTTLRNGHGWMFFFGFFFPLFWLIGAFMEPTRSAAAPS